MVLIETKQQQLAAIVRTYQALGGGGWMPDGMLLSDDGLCELRSPDPIPLQQPYPLQPSEELPMPAPTSSELAPPAGREQLPVGSKLMSPISNRTGGTGGNGPRRLPSIEPLARAG